MRTPRQRSVVFLKTGWMEWYDGANVAAGVRPIAGGSYNEDSVGSEQFNFLPFRGRMYGYARIGSGTGLNLRRIDPQAHGCEELSGVLVVWAAPHEGRGRTVVVGWYRNATVFARRRRPPEGSNRGDNEHLAVAAMSCAVCLPPESRAGWELPTPGEGGFGQAQVRYLLDEEGRTSDMEWVDDVLSRIETYTPCAGGAT